MNTFNKAINWYFELPVKKRYTVRVKYFKNRKLLTGKEIESIYKKEKAN